MICIQPIPPSAFFTLSSTKNTLGPKTQELSSVSCHRTEPWYHHRSGTSFTTSSTQWWAPSGAAVAKKVGDGSFEAFEKTQTVPGSLGPKFRKDYVGFQHVFVFHGDIFGARIAPNDWATNIMEMQSCMHSQRWCLSGKWHTQILHQHTKTSRPKTHKPASKVNHLDWSPVYQGRF